MKWSPSEGTLKRGTPTRDVTTARGGVRTGLDVDGDNVVFASVGGKTGFIVIGSPKGVSDVDGERLNLELELVRRCLTIQMKGEVISRMRGVVDNLKSSFM